MQRLSFFVLALTTTAIAQEPIKITTRLIETNVIVRDHHGPVSDLKVIDFALFDSGKQQKITVFHISKSGAPRSAPSTPPLPPGVFSNRYARAEVPPARHTILLIDTLNTDTADQLFAQKQVLLMLKTLEIHDPIAIYVLGDKSRLLQDFTLDRGRLTKAMESFRPELSHVLFMSDSPTPKCYGMTRLMCDGLKHDFMEMRDTANRTRSLDTLAAFERFGKYLTRVPGKKAVVWISNAFPSKSFRDSLGNESSYKLGSDEMRLLDRADVAIYPVHARGLSTREFLRNPRDPMGPPVATLAGETDTLNWIAEETGGRAFYGRNDVSAAIQEAIQDGDVTYTLGFYSQHDKPDGNFHELKVKVDRPGVEVRHRAGYFDVDTTATPPSCAELKREPDARQAAVPESASDIGLIAAIVRKDTDFQVAVQIDFKDLRLDQEDGKWKGSAEMAFVSQSANGSTLDVASKTLTFDMTGKAYQARQREGFALEQMIPVHEGTAKIRVVIVDRSGTAGSVSITPPKR